MELFSYQDYRDGLCEASQVGSPKDPLPPSPPPSETPDMVEGLAQAYAKMGGDLGFTDWASKNPGLVYPQMIKMGIALTAKTTPPTLPDLEDLTDEDIATMSSTDLKRCLLNYMEVTTGKQLDALKD